MTFIDCLELLMMLLFHPTDLLVHVYLTYLIKQAYISFTLLTYYTPLYLSGCFQKPNVQLKISPRHQDGNKTPV